MSTPSSTPQVNLWPRFVGSFWFFQIIGWTGMVVASFPFKLHFLAYQWSEVLMVTAVRDIPGFIFTLWMRRVYRNLKPERDGRLGKLAAIILGFSLLGAIADLVYVWSIGYRIGPEMLRSPDYLVMTFAYRLLIFTLWSLLYFGIKSLIARQKQAEALREAEMQVLRAQINPHFFFNALNTIQAGAGRDPRELTNLVQHLAGYLRFTLKHRENLRVPLGEEYDATVDYLAVEKARFCEGLELECSMEQGIRQVQVPGVLIQPLLENAIKHGRRTSEPPLKVRLRVEADRREIVIAVENSGEWVPEGMSDKGAVNGVGLANLRRRLKLYYPEDERLAVDLSQPGWVKVSLRLPSGVSNPH